jgi:hypothetical protein
VAKDPKLWPEDIVLLVLCASCFTAPSETSKYDSVSVSNFVYIWGRWEDPPKHMRYY